ncbi:MAG: phosphomannomutase CpsG [Fimbriimonadaceae bacterium]|nr:phosphomannomutase CpsG [Fimbriimonadaceae bacterium]
MGQYLPCFKAYDVRGIVPSELNPSVAYAIGRAYAHQIQPKTVCIGYDIRLSGPELQAALAQGLADEGVKVIDLGMVGTEMVYFATAHYGFDGGIMLTASHNPAEYNGMKMVRAESRPISGDSGLNDIEKSAAEILKGSIATSFSPPMEKKDCYADFVQHLLGFGNIAEMKPLKVLADAGNGAAGLSMRALSPYLPLQVDEMLYEPDGTFPNGVPNPILPESRARAESKLRANPGHYDFAVAWDGDYDRCFFLDGAGNFIEGYYIVGVLAQAILSSDPNQTIIYDPRLIWNTLDIVSKYGGKAVMCKSGHAFIKERMRAEDAIYGGEMSAHHYFKGHWYCDSGMIPLIMIADLISRTGKSLGELVGDMTIKFPCSGEVNSKVTDVPTVLAKVEELYGDGQIDRTDGLSVEYSNWRFNLRGSNTEPVIRLNVETRSDHALMVQKTAELLAIIRA